jgi:hypothetical protein
MEHITCLQHYMLGVERSEVGVTETALHSPKTGRPASCKGMAKTALITKINHVQSATTSTCQLLGTSLLGTTRPDTLILESDLG